MNHNDTFEQLLLSGATGHPWYFAIAKNPIADQAGTDVDYTGWKVNISCGDDPTKLTIETLNHDKVIGVLKAIAEGRVSRVSSITEREAQNFLDNPGTADFDAASADQVLQCAVLGKVAYG